jgi:hypothetical protein
MLESTGSSVLPGLEHLTSLTRLALLNHARSLESGSKYSGSRLPHIDTDSISSEADDGYGNTSSGSSSSSSDSEIEAIDDASQPLERRVSLSAEVVVNAAVDTATGLGVSAPAAAALGMAAAAAHANSWQLHPATTPDETAALAALATPPLNGAALVTAAQLQLQAPQYLQEVAARNAAALRAVAHALQLLSMPAEEAFAAVHDGMALDSALLAELTSNGAHRQEVMAAWASANTLPQLADSAELGGSATRQASRRPPPQVRAPPPTLNVLTALRELVLECVVPDMKLLGNLPHLAALELRVCLSPCCVVACGCRHKAQ